MGICSDKSLTFLKDLGYNVVRHPSADVTPLTLIGFQNGEYTQLGPLNLLITNPPGPLPGMKADIPAADINGQSSSKLALGIGANVLGTLIGAMGGNLSASLNYTNAQQIEFAYTGVTNDSVVPLEVGNYLRDAMVDGGNKILQQYVLGKGKLFLITKVAKSKKFTVKYQKKNGLDAKVDIPVLQGAVGGSVAVSTEGASESTIGFEGPVNLVFGFQCFEVGVANGTLTLTSVKAGGVVAGIGEEEEKGVVLPSDGFLELEGTKAAHA